ncbi:hypothetical protein QBC38DRAFT_113517 [Podospora fimiseda]|uniref:Uncharacterized protein n=1 Tax=Podospora fimiseda TaxID=252190 RepID=A0AAN7BTI1_9PEZI|nr:hypothetical protein QBC38DRAFT_113517 [Podospora fimiseda]
MHLQTAIVALLPLFLAVTTSAQHTNPVITDHPSWVTVRRGHSQEQPPPSPPLDHERRQWITLSFTTKTRTGVPSKRQHLTRPVTTPLPPPVTVRHGDEYGVASVTPIAGQDTDEADNWVGEINDRIIIAPRRPHPHHSCTSVAGSTPTCTAKPKKDDGSRGGGKVSCLGAVIWGVGMVIVAGGLWGL